MLLINVPNRFEIYRYLRYYNKTSNRQNNNIIIYNNNIVAFHSGESLEVYTNIFFFQKYSTLLKS